MSLLPGVIRSLLDYEDSPLRFERFCVELCREALGSELVPTSRTWDRGRNGRAVGITHEGAPAAVLCATLSTDLDSKLEADIRRLAATTQTLGIVYCTTRSLTEQACDALEARIRELHPVVKSVRVLGQIQFVALSERFEEIVRRFYHGEIHNIEQALLAPPDASPEPQQLGLRFALVTQTGDDARALRAELTKRLVLGELGKTSDQTAGQLAVAISARLHLPRSLSASYVEEVLRQLAAEGLVVTANGRACATEAGTVWVGAVPPEAVDRLLEGRALIRESLHRLSGHSLPESQFDRLWNTLQDGIADLFYSHGSAIVQMVAALITGESTRPRSAERVLLERIADRIAALFSLPSQGDEIRQAILDMFAEKNDPAFTWLTQICAVYVMMCSLGFEALSSQEVTRVLRGFRLVADSDVAISLLCQMEPNHAEVARLVNGWRALGGRLLAATPVLEEVAYHAWISEHDYTAMRDLLPALSDQEAERSIANAFVRSFRSLSKDQVDEGRWRRYITQYRGDTDRDFGPVQNILCDEYGFAMLPEPGRQYDKLAERAGDFFIVRAASAAKCEPKDLDYRRRDKCKRDGRLVGAVKAARDATREGGIAGTTIILSSARLLKEADEAFRRDLGQPDAVVSTAALGCLLTLTPGVRMGLGTLRGVLFDLGLAERMNPLQRYAYRLILASREYDVPYSRRITLQRELGAKLLADARKRGEPVREIRSRVLRSEDPEYSVRLVKDALDEMAVTPETRKEVTRLRAEVQRLRDELQRRDLAQREEPRRQHPRVPRRTRGR